jgi:hypothetical protein
MNCRASNLPKRRPVLDLAPHHRGNFVAVAHTRSFA